VRGFETVRIFEKGEMRASEQARWMSFSAEQTIQTIFSGLRSVLLLPERGDAMRAGSLIPTTP
jgi:hypothetical protein